MSGYPVRQFAFGPANLNEQGVVDGIDYYGQNSDDEVDNLYINERKIRKLTQDEIDVALDQNAFPVDDWFDPNLAKDWWLIETNVNEGEGEFGPLTHWVLVEF